MSRNLDYPMPMQGWIAKQMLAQVQTDAAQLAAALRNDDRLPAWTLTKLATGTDRIGAAARYLLYKTQNTPSYGADMPAAEDRFSPWRALGSTGALVVGGLILLAMFADSSGDARTRRRNTGKRRNPQEPRVWSDVERSPDGTWAWFARVEYPAGERRHAVRGGPAMGYATKAKAQAALDAFLARHLA